MSSLSVLQSESFESSQIKMNYETTLDLAFWNNVTVSVTCTDDQGATHVSGFVLDMKASRIVFNK